MKTPDFKYMLKEGWDKGDYTSPPATQEMLSNLEKLYACIPDDCPPVVARPASCEVESWVEVMWKDEDDDVVGITAMQDGYMFAVHVPGIDLGGLCSDPEAVVQIVLRYGGIGS